MKEKSPKSIVKPEKIVYNRLYLCYDMRTFNDRTWERTKDGALRFLK
jgi:hypothetical protein